MKTAFRGSGAPSRGVRGGGWGSGVSQAVRAGLCLAVVGVLLGASARADVPVTITYTADNIVGAWWQNGGAPVSQTLGSNANNWRIADTATLNLAPGHSYTFIWRVKNDNVNYPLTADNPAAFLAEILGPAPGPGDAWTQFHYLSSATPTGTTSFASPGVWSYAVVGTEPTLSPEPTQAELQAVGAYFAGLPWGLVSSYGSNGGSNIWNSVNGPVAGISTAANWIWSDPNKGGTGYNNEIYIRLTTGILVPEPGAGSLLGLSLLLLVRRRRRARSA